MVDTIFALKKQLHRKKTLQVKGGDVDDKEEGRGSMRDLVARQAPGEPDVTQLMNNPGLAAGAGRAQATQTDLVNYWLQKASGPKTNPCPRFLS